MIKLQVGDVVELSNGDIAIVNMYFKHNDTYGVGGEYWNEDGSIHIDMIGRAVPSVVRVIRNALSPLNEGKYE